MRYGLYTPVNYDAKKSYPLIVYLHGSTDTVSRDNTWFQETIQDENPSFVLTPKCQEANQGWGNTWVPTHTTATANTLALVDSLVRHYNIDKDRLYLYGISMGAFGVFSILEKQPGKFAAAYAVCGGSSDKVGGTMLSTPLWIFHGEADDIVPVSLSRQIYQAILTAGGKLVRYTEYPGVKHNSWENVGQEKSLTKWLFEQEKNKVGDPIPEPAVSLKAELQNRSVVSLTWDKPSNGVGAGKEIWYYKLFRDNKLIADVDQETSAYTDINITKGANYRYHVIAVNYNFKESKPSTVATVNTGN
jgi:dienelactone hydrolase